MGLKEGFLGLFLPEMVGYEAKIAKLREAEGRMGLAAEVAKLSDEVLIMRGTQQKLLGMYGQFVRERERILEEAAEQGGGVIAPQGSGVLTPNDVVEMIGELAPQYSRFIKPFAPVIADTLNQKAAEMVAARMAAQAPTKESKDLQPPATFKKPELPSPDHEAGLNPCGDSAGGGVSSQPQTGK